MSIIKNEIPILEFDTEQNAVINPTHENLGIKLPNKCVFAFLEGYIDEYARRNNLTQAAQFISATKYYPIYTANHKGEEVALCQAPADVWKHFPKEPSLYPTGRCGMRELPTIMRRRHVLWKSIKVQEKLLRKLF